MTRGVLLDTHSLLWLRSGDSLRFESKLAIGEAIASGTLFLSQMLLWELGLAMQKKRVESRPDLSGLTIDEWIREASRRFGFHFVPLSDQIAMEAALVPGLAGYGDPGDCFLIATAHVENLALVTRDARIIDLANRRPDYLTVVEC